MRSAVLSVLVVLLSGCQSFPDVPWCTELSKDDGFCVYWLTRREVRVDNKNQKLNGKTWAQIKAQSAMCPAEECFVPLKKYQENMCHQNKGLCPDGVGSW